MLCDFHWFFIFHYHHKIVSSIILSLYFHVLLFSQHIYIRFIDSLYLWYNNSWSFLALHLILTKLSLNFHGLSAHFIDFQLVLLLQYNYFMDISREWPQGNLKSIQFHGYFNNKYYYVVHFIVLNQACTSHRPACARFLKIDLVRIVDMRECASVSAPKAINNQWRDVA